MVCPHFWFPRLRLQYWSHDGIQLSRSISLAVRHNLSYWRQAAGTAPHVSVSVIHYPSLSFHVPDDPRSTRES